ncbi:MAG: PTS sugar transporter subunit IIA [Verrucomicrobia bacterium]|nr:MAG: PTS sugar transporter subunit IIA [Verrucomicrobiota bacterium]
MNLGDILSPPQIKADLRATNRWEAIDELIDSLIVAGRLLPAHREPVTAAVKRRETSMSTGIGFGIGIPHASTDLVTEVTAAFGRSRAGIDFDALDSQAVHLVTLLLVPQGQFQKHLHTLAAIAKVLRRDDFLKALDAAQDSESILRVIREYSGQR